MDGPSRSWQPTSRPNDSSFGERMTTHNSQRNPKFTSTRASQYEECKVYVKNVPADMSRESFEALFRNCGTVLSVHILEPKEGRNSTIGFVKYTSDEEVVKAIERFNGTQLDQSVLVVERAVQKDRDRNVTRNQEQGYYPKRDLQGNQYDSPSFQGYRPQNDHSQRDSPLQTLNAPEMNNNHFGMGNRQEEAIFNPRGPGRGEPPRVGNMGQQSNYYSGQVVNGGEVAVNNSQGAGVGYEQAVFNPRGPGRGGIQNSHLQPYQHSMVGQATYRQPYELSNQQAAMGVRVEEAVFNPRGPGRGGGMVPQSVPSYSPGRNSGLMNGSTNDSSYNQGNRTSWMSDGHQQHTTHIANDLHQEINVTGRLSQASSPQDTQHMTYGPQTGETGHFARESPNQSPQRREKGVQSCYKCGEVGHMARECSSSGALDKACYRCGEEGHFARECPLVVSSSSRDKGGRNCYKCGEAGHFARECPNQGEGEPVKRMPPVTYIPPELPRDIDELFQDAPHSGLNFEKYDSIHVIVTGKDKPPPIETFEQAGILEQCATNIRRAQFTKPTPIQKYAIPITLAGRDLMACAQTGSGKTVAYLLPVLTGMIKRGLLDSGSYLSGGTQSPAALCLAPTRELAVQIHKEVCKFAYDTVVQAKVCYGGVSVHHQLDKIQRGCHFLIATPGRLIDFVERSRISLANVQYLILDEADRMLDMGFEDNVRKIVEKLGMPDKMSRQTLMFSATFPDEIQRLAADFLKESYLFVAVGIVGGSNLDISQTVISVAGDDKQEKLFDILLHSGTDRTLIFVELKRVADFLACLLSQNKFPTTSISGDRTQQEREAALHDFRTGRAPVLVATSVAARGLDIADVKHVINYDLPQDIDEYVHRIGRTGRIGNKGKATSFFQPDRDEKLARSLVKVLSQAYQEVPEWLEQVAEEAVGSSYGPAGGRFASKDRRERDRSRGSAHVRPQKSAFTNGMNAVTKRLEQTSIQPVSIPTECAEDGEDWD